MAEGEIAGAARPTRRLILATVVAWVTLAFVLPLCALTLNAIKIGAVPLGYGITACAVLLALTGLALIFQRLAGGERGNESLARPLAMAGEAVGVVGFLAFAGAIASLGFDGLAYPLGVAAGLALVVILIAPRLALYPARSLSGFMTLRFGGVWPRRLELLIAILATVLLLSANLRGVALALQGFAVIGEATALAIATIGVALVWTMCPIRPALVLSAAAFLIGLLAILVVSATLSLSKGQVPFVTLLTGQDLADLAAMDQKLIIAKLSDFRSLKPMASPFLQTPVLDFAGIVLALALGVAALPHLLGRHIIQSARAAGEAPRRAALALAFVTAFLVILPALALMGRLIVETQLSGGISTAQIAPGFTGAAARGWIAICGAGQNIAEACAHVSGHKGILKLQDVSFAGDAFALAVPVLAALPYAVAAIFWAAAVVAGVIIGSALLAGLADAVEDDGRAHLETSAPSMSLNTVATIIIVLLLSLATTMLSGRTIVDLTAAGLALLASAMFPALLLGLYWRRMSAAGAVAAMALGLLIFAIAFFWSVPAPFAIFGLKGAALVLLVVPASLAVGFGMSMLRPEHRQTGR